MSRRGRSGATSASCCRPSPSWLAGRGWIAERAPATRPRSGTRAALVRPAPSEACRSTFGAHPPVVGCPAVIDLHAHVLPGLDDGAQTIDEACALARAAVADGIRVMVATPHVRHDYPTTPDQMEAGVARVRAQLAAEAIPLEPDPGAAIALDALPGLSVDDLRRLAFGRTRSAISRRRRSRMAARSRPDACFGCGCEDSSRPRPS